MSIKILEKGDIAKVKDKMEILFKKYGLPDVMRSDNGPSYASSLARFGFTKLASWWLSLGMKLDLIDLGKSYQNGVHEKMHLYMKNKLKHKIDRDLKMHQSIFEVWRKEYNDEFS